MLWIRELRSQPSLRKPTVKIQYGPSHQPLPVVGIFSGSFTYKGKAMQPVYVIKGLQNNLLGLPTITAYSARTVGLVNSAFTWANA
jgi:hypothetical protein